MVGGGWGIIEIARDLIEILLVSPWPYDVDHLVKWHSWMVPQIRVDLITKDAIVGNFVKLDCRQGIGVLIEQARVNLSDLLSRQLGFTLIYWF